MVAPAADPAQAYRPDANRAGRAASAPPPEWLIRWLALLICMLLEPWNVVRLYRSRLLLPSRWHERLDLPAGSAEEEAAMVRGTFGNSIRWLCRRHGIGPGYKDWPELSRAIVAFGGSIKGFRAGMPPLGLQWWEHPGVVPGMTLTPGFGVFAPPLAPRLEQQAEADVPPPALDAGHVEAAHARLPVSWLPVSVRQVFARAGPGPSTGPPICPGLLFSVMSDARGRNMVSPAVLIRAV